MKEHICHIRVRYKETDQMGVMHHSNYLVYMEASRTELLRDNGFTYKKMEEQGFLLPLVESHCKYFQPALYDDYLTIKTSIEFIKKVSIRFNYFIYNEDNKLLTEGYTIHAVVNDKWKISPLPNNIKQVLSGYVKDSCA